MFPSFGLFGMGTLLGVVAAGALGALLIGLLRHRRELERTTTISTAENGGEIDAPAKASSGSRLSA